MGKRISVVAMIIVAATVSASCAHDPLRRRPGETDLQYQQRVQENQRSKQERERQRQMDEQIRVRDGADQADEQRRRRERIFLDRLPAGTYAKDRTQPCREGFEERVETLGGHFDEKSPGEIFYFCVPRS